MTRIRSLLMLCVALCAFTAPSHAQNEESGKAPEESSGPAFYEAGGALDDFFGQALKIVGYLPFFDLTLQADPPFPWSGPDGQRIENEAEKALFQKWFGRDLTTESAGVWTDADGTKFTFSEAGVPQTNEDSPSPLATQPKLPWTSGEQKIDDAVQAAMFRSWFQNRRDAESAGEWTDNDGDKFVFNVQGAPQQSKLPLVVLWLVIGAVFFTLAMKFVNFRMFGHAINVVRGKYDNPNDHGEVSHFQALASALSATVGLGNIAGVAVAVSLGGPGATFWMILAGLLGMTLKFTECSLGQKFRVVDADGRVSGGPMHYLADGLKQKGFGGLGVVLALIFTVFCIGGSLAGGCSFQVNQSLGILKTEVPFFEENGWVYGVVMAILAGIVIIGGIQRIAQTAEKIVPTMCGVYVASALAVIIANIGEVPAAFGSIVGGALDPGAIYGGAIGALIVGFQRAAFSNEAGVGSASIAHAAAKTDYPVREGIVALLEPLIDTVLVCTMTALVLIMTNAYDAGGPHTDLIAGKDGAALTKEAFVSVSWLSGWFEYVLLTAVVLFAFSTMISWSYYGERCATKLFGPKASLPYKGLFLIFVVLGSIVSATNVLEFGDLMILSMAFPNILGLYFLKDLVKKDLDEYTGLLKSGEMKTYD